MAGSEWIVLRAVGVFVARGWRVEGLLGVVFWGLFILSDGAESWDGGGCCGVWRVVWRG